MTDKNRRPSWLLEDDVLRAFAVLAVIGFHVSIYALQPTGPFTPPQGLDSLVVTNLVASVTLRSGVPLFVFVSGLVLSLKYYANVSWGRFYRARAESVIPQYLIFSIAYYLVFALVDGRQLSLPEMAYDLVMFRSASHLWFFALIPQFYVLYPLLLRLYRHHENNGTTTSLLWCTLAVQLVSNVCVAFLPDSSGGTGVGRLLDLVARGLPWLFVNYAFYFMCGVYTCRNLDTARKSLHSSSWMWLVAAVAVIVAIAASLMALGVERYRTYGDIPSDSIYSVSLAALQTFLNTAIIVLCLKASFHLVAGRASLRSVVCPLGEQSFGIYLVHMFFVELFARGSRHWGLHNADWAFYPMVFFLTAAASYAAARLIGLLPLSEYVTGRRTSAKRKTVIPEEIDGVGRP